MNVIVEIDGKVSSRYKYNVWTVLSFNGENGLTIHAKDIRIFCSDELEEFLEFMKTIGN